MPKNYPAIFAYERELPRRYFYNIHISMLLDGFNKIGNSIFVYDGTNDSSMGIDLIRKKEYEGYKDIPDIENLEFKFPKNWEIYINQIELDINIFI